MGYDDVELRLLDGKVIDPVTDHLKVIRATAICRDHGLEVCALDTSFFFRFMPCDNFKPIIQQFGRA